MAAEYDSNLGFISGPSISLYFFYSVFNLMKDDWQHRFGADLIIVPGPYIHTNRNRLVQEFLEAGRDWLFMVDNDMVFEPRDVWTLFEEADAHGPGIYGGPYLDETGVAVIAGTWDKDIPQVYYPLQRVPSEPTEVGMVGAGFTLIHRQVFEAIGSEHWFAPIRPDGGEDVSFCWRAREAGFTPLLVPRAQPGHHKTFTLYASGVMRNIYGDDVDLVQVSDPRVAPQEVSQ